MTEVMQIDGPGRRDSVGTLTGEACRCTTRFHIKLVSLRHNLLARDSGDAGRECIVGFGYRALSELLPLSV